jgi:putative transposase
VTSDDHAGLVNAIAAVLPGAAWQRCRTHCNCKEITRWFSLCGLMVRYGDLVRCA